MLAPPGGGDSAEYEGSNAGGAALSESHGRAASTGRVCGASAPSASSEGAGSIAPVLGRGLLMLTVLVCAGVLGGCSSTVDAPATDDPTTTLSDDHSTDVPAP